MAIDLVTQDITNLSSSSAAATLNANFNAVEVALQSALDRKGGTNNEMEADLDLNGYDILNVGTIAADDFTVGGGSVTDTLTTAAASATSAQEDADRAEAALASISVDALTPEAFGAVGDGVVDDTAAIQAWADYALLNNTGMRMGYNKVYRCTDSIDFGNDTGEVGIIGLESNNSELSFEVNNKECISLVGIQNGTFFNLNDLTIRAKSGFTPSHGIVCARPKQVSGVRSSGNFIFDRVKVYGEYLGVSLYIVQSESNTIRKVQIYNDDGACVAMVKTDYFRGLSRIKYDALTNPIALGETVTGGTSGATATVVRISAPLWYTASESGDFYANDIVTGGTSGATARIDQGSRGWTDLDSVVKDVIAYTPISGTFVDGETITVTTSRRGDTLGSTAIITKRSEGEIVLKGVTDDFTGTVFGNGGIFVDNETVTASGGSTFDVNAPNGYYVINKATQFRDIEEDSTCTFQQFDQGFFVNKSYESLWPVIMVSNFNDFRFNGLNLNNLSGAKTVLIQQFGDTFVRPQVSGTGGCAGPIYTANYMHSTHWTSLYFGDDISTGNTHSMITFDALFAGAETFRIKCDDVNNFMYDVNFDANGSIDLGEWRAEGTNKFTLRARNFNKQFKAEAALEGELFCSMADIILLDNLSASEHQLKINYAETGGLSNHSASRLVTISDNKIEASTKVLRVVPSGGTGTADTVSDILLPNGTTSHPTADGAELNGETIYLLSHSASSDQIKLDVGGGTTRIRNLGNQDVYLSNLNPVVLIRDGTNNVWYYVSGGIPIPNLAEATGFTDMIGTVNKAALAVNTDSYTAYTAETFNSTFDEAELEAFSTDMATLAASHNTLLGYVGQLSGRVAALQAALKATRQID